MPLDVDFHSVSSVLLISKMEKRCFGATAPKLNSCFLTFGAGFYYCREHESMPLSFIFVAIVFVCFHRMAIYSNEDSS